MSHSEANKGLEQFFALKYVDPAHLQDWSVKRRGLGKTLATLNGSFDLLHAGHLQILFEAKRQADWLIVALNSDRSIQQYKHPTRPIVPLQWRLQMVAALACVDYVTFFDETDPRCFLQIVAPDVHVNGSEYGENCIEAETVYSLGARLHLVERIPGLATSDIIRKIKEDIHSCV